MELEEGEANGLLTTAEAATRLGVSPALVRQLVGAGRLQPTGETKRGGPLFEAATVERCAAERAAERAANLAPALGVRRGFVGGAFELPAAPASFGRGIDEPGIAARLVSFLDQVEAGAAVLLGHARSGDVVATERAVAEGERAAVAVRLARALASDAEARGGRQAYRATVEGEGASLVIAVRGPDLDEGGDGRSPGAMAVHTERLAALVIAQAEKARDFELSARRDDRSTFNEARAADRATFAEARASERAHVELVVAGLKEANRALADELREARERIKALEVQAQEVAKLREEALNNAAERDEMRLNAAAEREREAAASQTNQRLKERSLGEIMKLAPNVLPPMLRKLGLEVPTATESDVVMQNAASLFGEFDEEDRAQLGTFVRAKKGELAYRRFVAVCEAFEPEQDAAAAAAASAPSAAPPAPPVPATGASLSPCEVDAIAKRLEELDRVLEASMLQLEQAKKAGDRKAMRAAHALVAAAEAETVGLRARMGS